MKQYTYFISYQFNDKKGSGFGMSSLPLRKLITSLREVEEIAEYIKTQSGFNGVVIIHFQLLREEDLP